MSVKSEFYTAMRLYTKHTLQLRHLKAGQSTVALVLSYHPQIYQDLVPYIMGIPV